MKAEPIHIVDIDVVEVEKPATVILSVLWSNGRQAEHSAVLHEAEGK